MPDLLESKIRIRTIRFFKMSYENSNVERNKSVYSSRGVILWEDVVAWQQFITLDFARVHILLIFSL